MTIRSRIIIKFKSDSILIVLFLCLLLLVGCSSSENPDTSNAETSIEEVKEKVVNEQIEVELEEEVEKTAFEDLLEVVDFEYAKKQYSAYGNTEIKQIQTSLSKKGYDVGSADGIIGKKTITGVASFQYDLESLVTGVLTSDQLETLGLVEKMIVSVKFKSASMQYNNSVGNEWSYGFSVNSNSVSKGSTIKIEMQESEELFIKGAVTEYDKIEDNGYKAVSYTYNELEQLGSTTDRLEVIVTENRGRYSGNTALWHLNYSINCYKELSSK